MVSWLRKTSTSLRKCKRTLFQAYPFRCRGSTCSRFVGSIEDSLSPSHRTVLEFRVMTCVLDLGKGAPSFSTGVRRDWVPLLANRECNICSQGDVSQQKKLQLIVITDLPYKMEHPRQSEGTPYSGNSCLQPSTTVNRKFRASRQKDSSKVFWKGLDVRDPYRRLNLEP